MTRVVYTGLAGGTLALLTALVGMVEALHKRPIITGTVTLGQIVFFLIALIVGYMAARQIKELTPPRQVLGGALAGLLAFALPALLVIIGRQIPLRRVLINASPMLYNILTFTKEGAAGLLLLLAAGLIAGAVGALLASASDRFRGPLITGLVTVLSFGLFNDLLRPVFKALAVPQELVSFLYQGMGLSRSGAISLFLLGIGISLARTHLSPRVKARAAQLPARAQTAIRYGSWALLMLVLLWLPHVLGSYLTYVLVMTGLFALMGLGLNVEIGWAGLLDLGFVAFFAIGAYTVGILTSKELGFFSFTFWQAVPVAIIISLIAGVVLGVPVLGVRGDYLAIATLGFGEIVRILVLSDWLRPYTGGAQGIALIPKPVFLGFELKEQMHIYYLVIAACIAVLFVCSRLKDSRVGRAWLAMREDEDVAQAMGINLVRSKLLAYGMGAAFAGTGGAIFAVLLGSTYPHSFELLISINVLALIIVGGMGSVPGVFIGALILVGLPELLREFAEFRLLMYGVILIAMMLMRPQGFWPQEQIRRAARHTG